MSGCLWVEYPVPSTRSVCSHFFLQAAHKNISSLKVHSRIQTDRWSASASGSLQHCMRVLHQDEMRCRRAPLVRPAANHAPLGHPLLLLKSGDTINSIHACKQHRKNHPLFSKLGCTTHCSIKYFLLKCKIEVLCISCLSDKCFQFHCCCCCLRQGVFMY